MRDQPLKTTALISILAVVFFFGAVSFAQDRLAEATELILNVPIETEFNQKPANDFDEQTRELSASETSVFFSVRLNANQTARVEIEHDGMDIVAYARNPIGEKYIYIESPSGNIGKKVLLATAETDGVYQVEVRPVHTIQKPIKLKIELKEIRNTTENDHFINKTYSQIFDLSRSHKDTDSKSIADFRASVSNYSEIIRLSRIVGDKYWEGESLVFLGHSHFAIGEYQTALEMWIQARQAYREVNLRHKEGVAVNNIGAALKSIGDYERALSFFQEGDNLQKETSNRFDKAASLTNIGSTYFLLGQPQKAISNIEEALQLYTAMNIVGGQATSAGSLGKIYVSSGNYQKGIEYLEQSLKYAEMSKNRRQTIDSRLILGTALRELGREQEAFEMYSQADQLANELGIRLFIVPTSFRMAQVERERHNLGKAIEYLEKALTIVEKTRNELKNKDQRASYFATVQNIYELYTDLLVERSERNESSADISLAFEMSERSRARSLIELLQEARVDIRDKVDRKLIERDRELNDEINERYQARDSLTARKATKDQIDPINAEINALEIEAATLRLRIDRESPRYAELVSGKTFKISEVQNLLDDDTVLLEYKLGERRSFLWLVTKDSVEVFTLPARQSIEEKARSFYDSVASSKNIRKAASKGLSFDLSRILLSPVAEQIANKRLAIVADGILQYIPFSALPRSPSTLLADRNEVVFLQSASVLATTRKNIRRVYADEKTIAIFADPVFDREDSRLAKRSGKATTDKALSIQTALRDFRLGETLPRLLASRQEARNIARSIDGNDSQIRIDFEASLANIESAKLRDYKILHFATHGLLNSVRPELSGLVFSLFDQDGIPQDGFLSLNDIYNLDLSNELVVLSACQTALGKDVRGEGLIGLSRGFLYAGSNRIVASLWKVDDSATAEFMKRFYANHLKKGLPASKALQRTKIEMKRIPRYRDPFYWGAFTLLGDWR